MNRPHASDAPRPPPEVPGYRLSRVIGQGGMSTVWLGTQLSLSREVAIKVMLPDALADEVSRRRFENEARTIARLEHPHIVGIHEVGRTRDGLPWYSMPHLPRGHVGQRDLRDDPARIREILRALLSALGFAHARGVVHRDVKAENVLFDEADRPLLADFGIALRRGHGTRVTMTGLAVGSTAYMSPEQARGQQVDHRTDLYSVGVLAWEMLTGELPYQADDALSMAIMHAQNPLPKLPHELRHWQRFMDRAMAKSPARRFHDAKQMQAALDEVPQRVGQRTPRFAIALRKARDGVRHMPRIAWVPVGLLVAAGIGFALRTPGGGTPGPERGTPTGSAVAAGAAGGSETGAANGDPLQSMHRAAPESDVDRLLVEVREQLRAGRLVSPAGGNAVESLVGAWRSDRAHLALPDTTANVMAALTRESVRQLDAGADARAAELLRRAAALAREAGTAGVAPLQAQHREVEQALGKRIDRAVDVDDRATASRAVAFAREHDLPDGVVARLQVRSQREPPLEVRFARDIGDMVMLRDGDRLFASMRRAVTRDEYARFASATGREPAACRERGSLLRVVSPRDWTQPGFDQSADDPVVCVSWDDASAYAQWLSRQTGKRHRLSTAAEAALMPGSGGARAVSEWRSDCAGDCSKRNAIGRSWRSDNARRSLDAARGYDDVGFRLVRDP
ncbi:bifunctional serine/threonine-protein kinase/formylglycine-generating enzyme family protein [Luteimonas aestuarii]|nr:bifunctional serine/threonine-protein kinase/formylglycine-generating enzyme family protein [Luteimonas aestuarii]